VPSEMVSKARHSYSCYQYGDFHLDEMSQLKMAED